MGCGKAEGTLKNCAFRFERFQFFIESMFKNFQSGLTGWFGTHMLDDMTSAVLLLGEIKFIDLYAAKAFEQLLQGGLLKNGPIFFVGQKV